ncbi:Calcium-binding protein KRP1 [Linum perenne]
MKAAAAAPSFLGRESQSPLSTNQIADLLQPSTKVFFFFFLHYITINQSHTIQSSPNSKLQTSMAAKLGEFEDLLPVMADKLGGEGLIRELCNGFELLVDKERGVITPASLRRNAAVLGLQDLSDGEIAGMVSEGDLDGDGALNQMEFCVLMFRLSPDLMSESRAWLEEALEDEFRDVAGF